jgi:apolipoprotein N-acyltransferase
MRAGAAAPGSSAKFRSLGAWLDRQSPWRLRGIALLLGALGAAALPPVYALPVLILSFSGLVLLVDRTPRPLAAIALGWFFAWGYFVAGIYWVANALLSVSSAFGWLLPFAIVGAVGGLSALLAAFPALAVGLARMLWPAGPARVLVLAVCWTLFEWLRGWVLTGFPWNLVGTCWGFSDAMNQFAALVGAWGLSLVTGHAPPCRHCLWIEWPPIGRGRDGGRARHPQSSVSLADYACSRSDRRVDSSC